MTITAPKKEQWVLTAPSFPRGWRQAYNFAFHCARSGHYRTKVTRVNGQWRVWKLVQK